VTILAALALLLAIPDGERLRIRIQEPAWSSGTVSLHARVQIVAEVLPGDSLADAWMEVLREPESEWHRLSIPPARFLRLSEDLTLVCPLLEPRTLPGVRAGDTLRVRIMGARRSGPPDSSWALQIRLEEDGEREAFLLKRLEGAAGDLQDLRREFERDYRRLSRIERRSRDAEKLERPVVDDLWSIDDAWALRLETFQTLAKKWDELLDEAETDRRVDARRALRCRRSIDRFLRDFCDDDGPLGVMRQNLHRVAKADSAAERRIRFLALLEASDQLLDLLQNPEGELRIWRERMALQRILRSALREQKEVTEELHRETRR